MEDGALILIGYVCCLGAIVLVTGSQAAAALIAIGFVCGLAVAVLVAWIAVIAARHGGGQ